ncbi:MAG: hypothetical protein AAFV95_07290 [Bacteroidota bacterium]
MKRINLLYLLAIPAAYVLWHFQSIQRQDSVLFFGFAENKETEMNLQHPVEVQRLYVTTGEKVRKGQLLAEVRHQNLPIQIRELELKIQERQLEWDDWANRLRSSISQLQAQRERKTSELDADIQSLELNSQQNRQLIQKLKSLQSFADSLPEDRITASKVQSLEEEKQLIHRTFELDIQERQTRLQATDHPIKVQIRNLQQQLDNLRSRSEKLKLLAPTDGLIGNIHCKQAEHVSSFNTLISFYEESPTLVKGFVHESMILEVSLGDSLRVESTLHPDKYCKGVVTGLGSRIVEIPGRLRKMPELKTYGREVLISISADNDFLQKEKVMLQANRGSNGPLWYSSSPSPSNPAPHD